MAKRKTKEYYREQAAKNRRTAHTLREKHKAYKEGFKDGQRARKGDEF